MSEDGFDAADYVRVESSGGCSGLSYDLKFDSQKRRR
jgi:Fe-S cluster assembly iron-binding protein IscA